MTLKPNYAVAFAKIFLKIFLLIAILTSIVSYLQGKPVRFEENLSVAALGGLFSGIAVAVLFTPREITWDDESFKIRALFPGSGSFEWRRLEAWSPYGRGTFVIKFMDMQAFQIAPGGFRAQDWKAFRSMLEARFPEKKTSFWIGVSPIRFKKK